MLNLGSKKWFGLVSTEHLAAKQSYLLDTYWEYPTTTFLISTRNKLFFQKIFTLLKGEIQIFAFNFPPTIPLFTHFQGFSNNWILILPPSSIYYFIVDSISKNSDFLNKIEASKASFKYTSLHNIWDLN